MAVNESIIFQIAGIGILVVVVHAVLKAANRDEFAWLVTMAAVAVVLWRVIDVVNQLFQAVRTVFQM